MTICQIQPPRVWLWMHSKLGRDRPSLGCVLPNLGRDPPNLGFLPRRRGAQHLAALGGAIDQIWVVSSLGQFAVAVDRSRCGIDPVPARACLCRWGVTPPKSPGHRTPLAHTPSRRRLVRPNGLRTRSRHRPLASQPWSRDATAALGMSPSFSHL